MDKVRLILTAFTIAINVLPITGVLIIYHDNLLGLVFPAEVSDIIDDGVIPENPLGNFTLVDSQYDAAARTVTLTFEVTNPLDFDLSISSFSADVQCAAHGFPMGHVTLANPVDIGAGATTRVVIVAAWTEAAVNHFDTAHAGSESIDVELAGFSANVNGVTIDSAEHVRIPSFPVG
ncbi:MAG: LEA type 2 family protein [Candidatus Bathyarchaeota archaeon]|nr:LEA type 2 family protein [Candidatus Bathyarchaeota archaeon]